MPKRFKVLLVEDDPDQRSGMKDLIEEAGFEVVEAEDSEEAERRLKSSGPFDAFVLDWSIGTINTQQLMQKVGPGIIPPSKVIMITGYENHYAESRKANTYSAVSRLIKKPDWVDQLIPELQRIVAAKSE